MAEDTGEKELDLEGTDSEEGSDSTEKNSKKKFIIIGAGVALLAAAGVAAMFLLGGSPEEVEDLAEEVTPIEKAEYLELKPPFIISLPDRGRQRFLQATVTVMSRDAAALLAVEEHMPVVRHNLTNIFSAQTIASIQSSNGIEQVRSEATNELNKMLREDFGSSPIEEVLFTSFVMQ